MNLPQKAFKAGQPTALAADETRAAIARLLPTPSEQLNGRKGDRNFDPILARALESERRADALQMQLDRQLELSTLDGATEFLNEKGFHDVLDRELDRAKRSGGTGVLLLVDIDGLNADNEQQNREAGDSKLFAVAEVLRRAVRKSDCIARIDANSFAVLFAQTSWPRGERRAKALERELNEATLPRGGKLIGIVARVGVEFYRSGEETDALIKRADEKLHSYMAQKESEDYREMMAN